MPARNRSKSNRKEGSNPTAAEVVAARDRAGLTQRAAAHKIYATLRAWQSWEDENDERRMHPGLFELFLFKTGQLAEHAKWASRIEKQRAERED